MSNTRAAELIAILIGICLVCLLVNQIWLIGKTETDVKNQMHSILSLSGNATDGYINQAKRLSQMLLLNLDVSKFIYQGRINEGSRDIQTAIDTMRNLPSTINVNPYLAEIMIYSNTSGYLLTSQNLFFNIDKMYPIMAVDGLSSGQFRTKYLTRREVGFFPVVSATVNGLKKRVIPYSQVFPINNPSANSGKIVLFLDEAFLLDQMKDLPVGEEGWYCIVDNNWNIICSSNDKASTAELTGLGDGTFNNLEINGTSYFVSILSSSESGLKYISAISHDEIKRTLVPIWLILMLSIMAVLIATWVLGIVQFFRNQNRWKKLNSLIGDSSGKFSYELIAETISSIIGEEKKKSEELSFKGETLLRRLIYERKLSDEDLILILNEISDGKAVNGKNHFRVLKLIIQEDDMLTNIDDVDFSQIAVQKEAKAFFHDWFHVYTDMSFNTWVFIWNSDSFLMERNINLFWESMKKLLPLDCCLAISSEIDGIQEIRMAPSQCEAVSRCLINENSHGLKLEYDEIKNRNDNFVFTNEDEKSLVSACLSGSVEQVERILDNIKKQNFSKRKLSIDSTEALMEALHITAVNYCIKKSNTSIPSVFKVLPEAKRFFLTQAGKGYPSRNAREDNTKSSIISYIETNYSDPSLNLAKVAADLRMKENYLYHFMSNKMGNTFSQYLEDYRLDKAKDLLTNYTECSINEAAVSCGYSNPQTFRRAFKKRFGQLPSELKSSFQ